MFRVALLLGGIALVMHVHETPGTQWALSLLAGFLIGASFWSDLDE